MTDKPSEKPPSHPAWRVLENFLWGFALMISIPPIASDSAHPYSLVPALVMGGSAFFSFIGLKIWHREETVASGIIKAAIYILFVVAIYARNAAA